MIRMKSVIELGFFYAFDKRHLKHFISAECSSNVVEFKFELCHFTSSMQLHSVVTACKIYRKNCIIHNVTYVLILKLPLRSPVTTSDLVCLSAVNTFAKTDQAPDLQNN